MSIFDRLQRVQGAALASQDVSPPVSSLLLCVTRVSWRRQVGVTRMAAAERATSLMTDGN